MVVGSNSHEHAGWIRSVRASWRSLTGGTDTPDSVRSTLIAVSGGADSAALAIALATLNQARVVLGLVLHDLRPSELVADDRRRVEALGRLLDIRVVCEYVRTGLGNAEHEARKVRYQALAGMATSNGCSYVATGHHAHDQIETLMLALCRGGSVQSLMGIRPVRKLQGVQLVRPMLNHFPEEARSICEAYGYRPRVDATNVDPARARAWFRSEVLPALTARYPRAGSQLSSTISDLQALAASSVPKQCAKI